MKRARFDWVGFFRPSLVKVVLAVVLLAALVPFVSFTSYMFVQCVRAPCPPIPQTTYLTLLQYLQHPPSVYAGTMEMAYSRFSGLSVSYAILFSGIVICYIASCVLIFVFDKVLSLLRLKLAA